MKLQMKPTQPRLQAEAISSHPDFDRGPRKAVLILVATTALFFVLLFAWMSFAALDISVNAQGAVIPSSRVQQIQSMEGGILQALQAREGMQVKKGDVLATVQNLQFNAEQGEAQQGLWGAQAALVRLDAEARNVAPAFPAELEKNAPDLVREQRTLWQTRRQERETSLETLARQLAQRQQELAEARARHQAIGEAIGPAREALAIEEKLAAANAGARADLLAAQQRYTSQKGELETTRIAIGRIQAAVAEAQARLSETRARFLAETGRTPMEHVRLRRLQLGRELLLKYVGQTAIFQAIEKGIARSGADFLILTRLIPLFPYNIQNYAYGLTAIPFWTFTFISALTTLPGIFIYTLMASELIRDGVTPLFVLKLTLAGLALFALIQAAKRYARYRRIETSRIQANDEK